MTASHIQDQLIEIRRHIHRNPELGYQEHKTSAFVCQQLDKMGIPYQKGYARTGIVAEWNKGPGKCVALRADMDALPILEDSGVPFPSENPGVMHACGHDMHTTMLLGAAMLLKDKDFNGKIKFIFQPSEEGTNGDPENKSGGQRMVEEGALDGADHALGIHVHPLMPVGTLTYALGDAMACTSSFTITVQGKAGHAGAAPHLATDAIVAACSLVQNLHTIVSRNIAPIESGVVSITKINGGTASNIIADQVEIVGTIRTLSMENYDLIIERFNQIMAGTSLAFGTPIDMEINSFYPSVINDKDVHEKLSPVAQDIFSKQGVIEVPPMLGGEDFAFMAHKAPAMFYFLGAKYAPDSQYFVHHPKVMFNEDCMPLGSRFLAEGALRLLEG